MVIQWGDPPYKWNDSTVTSMLILWPLGIGIVLIGRAGPGVNNVIQGLYDHLQA